jgi:hypothetical protein
MYDLYVYQKLHNFNRFFNGRLCRLLTAAFCGFDIASGVIFVFGCIGIFGFGFVFLVIVIVIVISISISLSIFIYSLFIYSLFIVIFIFIVIVIFIFIFLSIIIDFSKFIYQFILPNTLRLIFFIFHLIFKTNDL